jgi:hypothetical protein
MGLPRWRTYELLSAGDPHRLTTQGQITIPFSSAAVGKFRCQMTLWGMRAIRGVKVLENIQSETDPAACFAVIGSVTGSLADFGEVCRPREIRHVVAPLKQALQHKARRWRARRFQARASCGRAPEAPGREMMRNFCGVPETLMPVPHRGWLAHGRRCLMHPMVGISRWLLPRQSGIRPLLWKAGARNAPA